MVLVRAALLLLRRAVALAFFSSFLDDALFVVVFLSLATRIANSLLVLSTVNLQLITTNNSVGFSHSPIVDW